MAGLSWLVIATARHFYQQMLVWLNLGPVSSIASVVLIILAVLIILPLFVLAYFSWNYVLSRIDAYLDR